MYFRRIYILCCLGVFYRCLLGLVDLWYFSRLLLDLQTNLFYLFWKWGIEISNYYSIVYFSLNFCQVLLHIFFGGCSFIRCIYVYNCCIFQWIETFIIIKYVNISNNICCLKVLSDISIAIPAFMVVLICLMLFVIFLLKPIHIFESKECLLKTIYN